MRVNADGSVDRVGRMNWAGRGDRVFIRQAPAGAAVGGPTHEIVGEAAPDPRRISPDGTLGDAARDAAREPPPELPPDHIGFATAGPVGVAGLGANLAGPGLHMGPPEFGELRRHFLWINLLSLGIVVVLAMIAFSLIVRWPVRGLLMAIEDIEHGSVPAAGGMTAPSELRQIGAALHRLARQLRSSTQERELMLAGMSHDLRSPLARIQAAIELRARPEEDWTPVLRDVREIDHIVGQCIDFVRDGQDEPLGTLSLDELVRGVLRGPADDGIELDLQAPMPLRLRRQSMARALRNLLDNARVHGRPPLRLRTRRDTNAVLLSLEDQGEGIDPQNWEQLLKPFAQGSRARNPGGAGLGLAIVQRVIAQHGGSVEMQARSAAQPFSITLRLPAA